ncbi:MAG: septation protein A [Cycloclasticus sp. symbiont of Poecilosclerida sp. M]|nr:MAG: septation protein A [Cycloclasticus sp. symbiont of Poecilosclerida sp. M]
MKFLSDFFPILLFFIAYKWQGIYAATVVAIAASTLQVSFHWLKHRRFEQMHLSTLAIICVFGGATLYFQDETFIKWKPTIINWLFALACIGSQFIGEKPLIKRMMGSSIQLPSNIWLKLNMAWAAFFLVAGSANLYVMYHFDTDTWVNFKLFGMLGLTTLFIIAQGFYLSRYIQLPELIDNSNSDK